MGGLGPVVCFAPVQDLSEAGGGGTKLYMVVTRAQAMTTLLSAIATGDRHHAVIGVSATAKISLTFLPQISAHHTGRYYANQLTVRRSPKPQRSD